MSLLKDAAVAWTELLPLSFQITYGKSKKLHTINLSFQEEHFFHLCGMQYINDIDFQIPISSPDFLSSVMCESFDPVIIEKSTNWDIVKGRLEGIVSLKQILESDFSLYFFDPYRLGFYTKISATYLIKDQHTGDVVFLFVDGSLDASYCRSVFKKTANDFTTNQTKLKVLRKIRVENDTETVIFDKIKSLP